MAELTHTCAKCGRELPHPAFPPAYCPKCELVNSLLVERYTRYERKSDEDAR